VEERYQTKKRFGQHFLSDKRIAQRIVSELNPGKDETILEIGPGEGAISDYILERAHRLVAIELDRDLIPILDQKFSHKLNFNLIEADALKVDLCRIILPATEARLVANLPYNVSTAILQRLILMRHCIKEMVLMFQKEVVDRIVAPEGSADRGFLSVMVQAYCDAETLFHVPPAAFRPPPKVYSSVVRIRPHKIDRIGDQKLFESIVGAGFAQRRKTLLNNFRSAPEELKRRILEASGLLPILERCGIDPGLRAEALTVDQWISFAEIVEKNS
jgi:16S rRNA (adenine1518-N6/adenine1519-N6)-dimethyltransferase